MSSKYLAKSRSFVYASRLSRLSPVHIDPATVVTPHKSIEHHQYTPTKSKAHLHDKVDSILKHNNYLLSQNNKFVSLIRDKDNQVIILENRIDELERQLGTSITGLKGLEHERNQFISSCKEEITVKEYEISHLLTHTDMLKSKLSSLESQHKIQILNLREGMIMQSEIKFEYSKKSQLQSIEMYELQILKLKDFIQSNKRDHEARIHEQAMLVKQQEEEIRKLSSDLKHLHTVKAMTEEEERINFQNKLSEIRRELINKHDKQKGEYQITLKRLKKDITQKQLENNRLTHRMEEMKQSNEAENDLVSQEKTKASIELEEMAIRNKELLEAQKALLQEISEADAQNVRICSENFIKTLESQNRKLSEINNLKSQEIVKLQTEILQLKQTHATQLQSSDIYEQALQAKLSSQTTHNQQEVEFLKIKMAQLHSSDVASLLGSYEKQIVALCQQIRKLQDSYKECRAKLHKSLQEKTQLRKHYEVQISKTYNKNIELKVMLQAKDMEMKQNSEIINLKHSAVSLNFIKNSEEHQKENDKRSEDNKKLQELVVYKDLEIAVLNEKLNNAKKSSEDEKREHLSAVEGLKATNQSLIDSQRKEKQFYEKELKKKSDEFRKEKQRLEEELSSINSKTYEDLLKELETLQKQKSSLEMRIQKQMNEKEFHIKASRNHQEIAEVMRLQSSAALQQQKSNSKNQQEMEGERSKRAFKDHMQSKSREIEQLKRRLFMKQQDLREGENRQKDLQLRLQGLVELLKSKSDLQKRVMNLGMDNNLIKNQAELFRQ